MRLKLYVARVAQPAGSPLIEDRETWTIWAKTRRGARTELLRLGASDIRGLKKAPTRPARLYSNDE